MEGEAGVMRFVRAIAYASVLLALASAGCGEGKRPFLMVQTCMPGESADFARLGSIFQAFAQKNGLSFSDGSAAQTALSKKLAESVSPNVDPSELGAQLQLSVHGSDEFAASASNIPENKEPIGQSGSPNQVVIGFNARNETNRTQNLVAEMLAQIEEHWDVVNVPPDSGAFLLDDCQALTR